MAAQIHPQVNRVSQETVALVAHINHRDFARLLTDRRHARQTLQGLRRIGQGLQCDEFAQEAGSQLGACAGQGSKESVIGMFLETLANE